MKFILKEYLQSIGKSVYWLEKETKIPHKTLSGMVNRKTKSITYEHLGRICKTLNCTPDVLFELAE